GRAPFRRGRPRSRARPAHRRTSPTARPPVARSRLPRRPRTAPSAGPRSTDSSRSPRPRARAGGRGRARRSRSRSAQSRLGRHHAFRWLMRAPGRCFPGEPKRREPSNAVVWPVGARRNIPTWADFPRLNLRRGRTQLLGIAEGPPLGARAIGGSGGPDGPPLRFLGWLRFFPVRYLITGGSGYIGSRLVGRLVK